MFRLLHHPLWCPVVNMFIQHVGSQYLTRVKSALLRFYPPTVPQRTTSTWRATSDWLLTPHHADGGGRAHLSELIKPSERHCASSHISAILLITNYVKIVFKYVRLRGKERWSKIDFRVCLVCLKHSDGENEWQPNGDLHAPLTPLELLEHVDLNTFHPAWL